MTFKKGVSGNPAGRKPGTHNPITLANRKIIADVKQLAKEASKDAMDTLIEVMKDRNSPVAARVTAAQAILDRGWGKPSQTIEATVNVFDRMSDDELRDFIARGVNRTSTSDRYLELEGVKEGVRGEFGEFYTASVEGN